VVGVRLAEDRRARVPFALVGVLLLVGSAALSARLAAGPTPRTDDSVGIAVERTTAASSTAIRGAVARAGRQAAREPVTASANTTLGRVLNDSTPYRDYLRIRIYLAAREALGSVRIRANDVRGSVALQSVSNASTLREAKRRVSIEPAGTGDDGRAERANPGRVTSESTASESDENAGLQVRIEGVTVTATRDGRVVEREQLSPTLIVATPALALHERVERFESRLNRGPLAPGLGRRLTARLYAVAWARGYAQYGRAPIQNVVANRHVELAANGAVLREQRVAFGRSDPAGRRALAWATARVGATDLLAGLNNRRGTDRTDKLLAAANRYQNENPMPGGVAANRSGRAERNRTLSVGVNRTADRAFSDLVTGENGTGLDRTLRSAYEVDTRLVAAVRKVERESEERPDPASPGTNWTLTESDVRTATRVKDASGPPPGTPEGWHLLGHGTRRVVRTHALVANWTRRNEIRNTESRGDEMRDNQSRGTESRQTVQRWTETFTVRVGVAGEHGVGSGETAPPRPVAGVHERGGALDGPNLAGISETATDQLVADRGGFDALARRAVVGTLDTRPEKVAGRRPAGLRQWAYRDLAALREGIRNVSVSVPRREVLDERPPAAELAERLRARRAELLDAPGRYDGVSDRARLAARTAYLDRVLTRLDERADRESRTRVGVERALADAGGSLDRARRILRTRTTAETPPPRPMAADGPGGPVNLSVTGAPPYLTLAKLDREKVAAIPEGERRAPLAARNRNLFAVPYGEAADAVASSVAGSVSGDSGRVGLREGALALRAANRTLAERENRSLARQRNRLQASLSESMRQVRRHLVAKLALARFDLAPAQRRAAVREGLARWNTTSGRALAVANGSAAEAIAAGVVQRRPSLRRSDRRDWVQLRAELAVESARREVDGPPRSEMDTTTTTTRKLAEGALENAVKTGLGGATERASDRWFGEVLGSVPAGLPVAPVPGYWYATVNVWRVGVEGQYARFAVRAPQGSPVESVAYVRESETVRLDVDDDGERELLGRTEPVSFETGTTVVVVVPPGPPGVGDRGGNPDETSPGWTPD
jgi:hypothetical protein